MERSIKFYINKELLIKEESVKSLAREYLAKSKNNLITIKILSEIQDDKKFREKLNVPESYSTYE